jgi:hypothetical protein
VAVAGSPSGLQRLGDRGDPVSPAERLPDAEPDAEVTMIELGAVNAWPSIGRETLWRAGQADAAHLEDLAARRPDLARCAHPVAVEVAAATPRPCWVGVVVSGAAGPVHLLDLAAVREVFALGAHRPG